MTSSIMKTAIVTGSLLLALAGRAAAQPGMTEPALDSAPPPPAAQAPAGEQLSESTALALSLGGTIGSWGLLLGSPFVPGGEGLMVTAGGLGIFFAPSFGNWYAGQGFTRGLGLRLGGGAIVIAGAIVALMEDPISFGHDDGPEDEEPAVYGPAIAIAGLGLLAWGTVDDIVRAPGAARRKNRERAGLALTPLVTPKAAGFVLGGRF
jgi:hypothetical protein